MIHELKTWPGPFSALLDGTKTYEIRHCNDRAFRVGDTLRLCEWAPSPPDDPDSGGDYTGRDVTRVVTYMTPPGEWGLPTDLCVMSLAPNPAEEKP